MLQGLCASLKIVHNPESVAKRTIEGIAAACVEDIVKKFDRSGESVAEVIAITDADVYGGLSLYVVAVGSAVDDGGIIVGIGEVHF